MSRSSFCNSDVPESRSLIYLPKYIPLLNIFPPTGYIEKIAISKKIMHGLHDLLSGWIKRLRRMKKVFLHWTSSMRYLLRIWINSHRPNRSIGLGLNFFSLER